MRSQILCQPRLARCSNKLCLSPKAPVREPLGGVDADLCAVCNRSGRKRVLLDVVVRSTHWENVHRDGPAVTSFSGKTTFTSGEEDE